MAECILNLKKESFLTRFLLPISKLADNVSLVPHNNSLYAISASADGSIILLATYNNIDIADESGKINLPDIKKFNRLIDCIEEDSISLKIKNNCIQYNTDSIKFNYHLLEDSYMQKCPVNPEKIKNLQYDSFFDLPVSKFNELLKYSSITSDTDKLYFYTKNDSVYAELNDFERQNVNSITYHITNTFEGVQIKNALPLNLENIRMLAGIKMDKFSVKINNTLKVTLFEASNEDTNIKFVISALVK